MSKIKTKVKEAFVCEDCGHELNKWQGQCNQCQAWNTIKSIKISTGSSLIQDHRQGFAGIESTVQKLQDVNLDVVPRFSTGSAELDRVLGGGFMPGSTVLIGGSPGTGKSTLLLQTLCHVSETLNTLYVSGEESLQQIAQRAHRLGLPMDAMNLLSETSVEKIIEIADKLKPAVLVIDSIQVMHIAGVDSAPGGVAQVRETAALLTRYAKQKNPVILLVGHVTKDHSLAGPMTLSHIIDTQLMLENTAESRFLTLRATKNRFGQVNELGIFSMTESGLKEVKNPSAIFLNRSEAKISGSLISVLWEGTRPLLVELQALVVSSQMENPRRVTVGMEFNRLAMLLAILCRHANIYTASQDVFINVVGGVRISETSADLACVLAIISSLKDQSLPKDMIVFGEIGLSGEIRPVSHGQERIFEAAKHGFTQAIVPKNNMPKKSPPGLSVFPVEHLREAIQCLG